MHDKAHYAAEEQLRRSQYEYGGAGSEGFVDNAAQRPGHREGCPPEEAEEAKGGAQSVDAEELSQHHTNL